MQQWEYMTDVGVDIQELGKQGWELAAITGQLFYFRRPIDREGIYKDYNGYLQGEQEGRKQGIRDAYEHIQALLTSSGYVNAAEMILEKFKLPETTPAPATREDLISGGGTEREKELFQMGYEWGLKNAQKNLQEIEESHAKRIKDATYATAFGCLAAATGKPLSDVSKSGFKARTLQGDAWEYGWEFINESIPDKA